MINNKKILAIIPARSGSKGLIDKNIKLLNGKPMIAYTIEAAKKSEVFDNIIVSTDSNQYADIAREYGASIPFLRPDNLSTDEANSLDVIEHVLYELDNQELKYDYFMFLQPTSPLRDAIDIKNAIDLLFTMKANSVVSVCEAEHSPLLMNTLPSDLRMDSFIKPDNNKRRQELQKYYRLNGAIYLSKTKFFLDERNFYKNNCYAYLMNKENSIDVDDEFDFNIANLYLTKKV